MSIIRNERAHLVKAKAPSEPFIELGGTITPAAGPASFQRRQGPPIGAGQTDARLAVLDRAAMELNRPYVVFHTRLRDKLADPRRELIPK